MNIQLSSGKRRKMSKVITLVIVVAIVCIMIPVLIVNTQATGTKITAFEGETNLGTQVVTIGAEESELALPAMLSVTLDDGTNTNVSVVWSGFDLSTPGSYITTPVIAGYTNSVPLPYFTIVVASPFDGKYTVEAFELGEYQAEVSVGVGTANIALPKTVRALCTLPDSEGEQRFAQEKPSDVSGYTAPEDADTKYEDDKIVIYTYERENEEPGYRVYGSLNEGTPAWYASDKAGKPSQLVADVSVEWDTSAVDTDKVGEYTAAGSFKDENVSGEAEPKAKVIVTEYQLERGTPQLDYCALAENQEQLDYYLSPVVRVLTPVDMTGKKFEEAVPTEEDNPNDTFYRFGYASPEEVETPPGDGRYNIYSAYASPMEYSDRVVVTYRIFGSVDGGENAWYVCDEAGNITHMVSEVPVEWNTEGFDMLTPGEYTIMGAVAIANNKTETAEEKTAIKSETKTETAAKTETEVKTDEEALPLAATLKVTISEVPVTEEAYICGDENHDHE